MSELTETKSGSRGLLIGIGVVVGSCLLVSMAFLPRAFRTVAHTRAFRNAGESMNPSLYPDDLITVDTGYYESHNVADGDIIAFHHGGLVMVKRVVAVGGETIEGRQGKLIRNGVMLTEPYVHTPDEEAQDVEGTFSARTIPADQVFVAGDWRSRSLDSRADEYAPVHTGDVIGKVVYIYSSSHAGQQGRRF